MKTVQEKKGFKASVKEGFRKFIVSLKKRPHNIALVLLAITFIIYSFNLTPVSNTSAYVNKSPMGLCSFCTMLFSILSLVCFLNAFPKRKKPIIWFVILLYVMIAICAACDIIYIVKINERLAEGSVPSDNNYVYTCKTMLIIHLVFLALSTACTALIPVFGKLFNKIDTSVDLGEDTNVENLTLSDN